MNNIQFAPGRLTLLALLIVLLTLAACQNEEQLDEAVATLEATAEPTEVEEPTEVPPTPEPTPVPPTPEPTHESVIESEHDMISFTTSDDSLSFVYPDGWSVEETGPGRAILSNSGDVRINITLLPANMLADYGLHMGNTAEEALQFVPDSGLFITQQEDTQVGEIQSLELENTSNAAQMSIATPDQEGALISSMYSDRVVAFISVAAPTGEYTNFEESVRDIVDSISVSVTADELMALIANSGQG
ncbi:MAG: hypothetical protein AMJ56_21430 [Anaerolineae bacterium SG8_19]|jgi:hypothetical protein|nr:MAG: hypothetical protein AMJ56_21430 [Anaerolineae bacterium SG8_19]HCB48487.1 hypothetical protein [Chloroflexota bacterium]